jgi:hypothetical protein
MGTRKVCFWHVDADHESPPSGLTLNPTFISISPAPHSGQQHLEPHAQLVNYRLEL